MSVARLPQLGSKPVPLNVKLPQVKEDTELLSSGLQMFYRSGEFADVVFLCSGQRFPAHCVVLACQSHVLKENLSLNNKSGSQIEVSLDIPNPEAVKLMLDHMYNVDDTEWAKYNLRTQEINRDVLSLARQFCLQGLTNRAMRWMAKDLNTGNVVERLSICEDFQLSDLSERILEQLTNNRQALAEVAHSPQIMTYPRLMQAMLQCAAGAPEGEEQQQSQPKSKKARKS